MFYPVYNLIPLRLKTCTQVTHSKNIIRKSTAFHASTTIDNIQEPVSTKEALKCPKWHKAMQEEIEALLGNHTWTLVPHPSGRGSCMQAE